MIGAITLVEYIRSHERSLLDFYTSVLDANFEKHLHDVTFDSVTKALAYVKYAKTTLEKFQLNLTLEDQSTVVKNKHVDESGENTVDSSDGCILLDNSKKVYIYVKGVANKTQDKVAMSSTSLKDVIKHDTYVQSTVAKPPTAQVTTPWKSGHQNIKTKGRCPEIAHDETAEKKPSKINQLKNVITNLSSSFRAVKKSKSTTNLAVTKWHTTDNDVCVPETHSNTTVLEYSSQSMMVNPAASGKEDDKMQTKDLDIKPPIRKKRKGLIQTNLKNKDAPLENSLLTVTLEAGINGDGQQSQELISDKLEQSFSLIEEPVSLQSNQTVDLSLFINREFPLAPSTQKDIGITNDGDSHSVESKTDIDEICFNISSETVEGDVNESTNQCQNQENSKCLNLILFGASGNGKSATGNSILLSDCFKVSNTMSCVSGLECHSADIKGLTISVIDCSGWRVDGDLKMAENFITKALELCSYTVDGFMFVLKYGSRYTQEQNVYIKYIKGFLGEDVMTNCGFCIFTHGDLFEEDQKTMEYPLNFKNWCKSNKGEIKKLFKECNKRCVLLNNMTKDITFLNRQIDNILKYRHRTKRYTLEDYKSNEKRRLHFISEISMPERIRQIHTNISNIRAKYYNHFEKGETTWDSNTEEFLKSLIVEINKTELGIPDSEHNVKSMAITLKQQMLSKGKILSASERNDHQ